MKLLRLAFTLILTLSLACQPNPETIQEKIPTLRTGSVKDVATCGTPPASATQNQSTYVVKTIKLIPEALGVYNRQADTQVKGAQDYFDQGIQLRYAFAVNEAVSSFREAQKMDSTCAMCFWGEAWALGSYINGHMKENKAPLALDAIIKAASLVDESTPSVDKALIDAMTIRYVEDYQYDQRRHNDSLYADAMAQVYEQFPEDPDVATLYADALFLLEPRGGTREMDNPRLMIIHDVLEKVLAENIEHPGACHLYIHATESTDFPELAESCADYLGNTIPGASHINHMPSHTYNEIGRWGDGVRANIQASLTDKSAVEEGNAFAIYPGHNLHMLLYAAAYDGQGAVAMQAGRDYTKLQSDPVHHALTALRFGRFDDILALERPQRGIVSQSLWDFCQGYARLKKGETDFARVFLSRVKATADTTKARFRFEDGAPVLKAISTILEGEIAWTEGDLNGAITAFKKGVKLEDALPYSEPEPYPFSVRHWLGAAQMEARQFQQAEQTYLDEIDDHPRNGWSLYGLRESLKAQGKPHASVQEQFVESWARADVLLKSTKF